MVVSLLAYGATFSGQLSRANFLAEDLFRIKIFIEMLLFRDRLHSVNFFKRVVFWIKLIFQKSNVPYYILFLESYLFRAAFSRDATFYSSYLLRRVAFLQHIFSEELLFYSYASFSRLHFLLVIKCC